MAGVTQTEESEGSACTPEKPTDASPLRALPLALVLALGAVLSIAIFFIVRDGERHRTMQEFEWRARSQTEALSMTLHRYEDALATLRNLFTSSEEVTFAEFRSTAGDLLARNPGIHRLDWAPRVTREERARFESAVGATVAPGFAIRDLESGTAAGDRASYLPILFLDPFPDNETLLGGDLLTGPHGAAMTRAIETGAITATRRVPLGRTAGSEVGWMMFSPIYATGAPTATPAQRQQSFAGFIVGSFRLTDLVSRSLEDTPQGALELLLVDRAPQAPEPFLIHCASGTWRTSPPPSEEEFRAGVHRAATFHVGGRRWTAHFRPSASWLASQRSHYAAASLIAGLLLTGVLAASLLEAQRRTALVQRLVHERTAELRAAQVALRQDIRERDAVEVALRASEERYRAFIAQSTEAIWRYEFDEPLDISAPKPTQLEHLYRHAFLAECNDAVARMYGYDRAEEIIGARLSDMMPRADPVNVAHLQEYVESGFRLIDSESHEFDRHGRLRIFLNNIIGIIEGGRLVRAWGTQRDITAQRRAEEQRVENEARLRLALAAADLGTWEWDIRSERVTWSEGTERMFGLVPGTFDGRYETYLGLILPEDRPAVRASIEAALTQGAELAHEHRVLRPDGTVRWVTARGDVIRDSSGAVVRMLGAVMDVTEQRSAAEERALIERKLQETQKLESLGVLAGGIAHDFNNLLTGILGNASLARLDLPATSPAQPSLEQIEHVAQRAAELCKQMLAYSGRGHFVVQRIDLSQLVEETGELIQISISKSAVLKYSLARDLPAIAADATQLRQIVMNLVINASDAIGEKSGVISITTGVLHADRAYLTSTYLSPSLEEGDYVFLEVSDNGCGMSPETQARIFDPFFTTKFTGRGLGLAAVLGIVRGHRGALKVYSEPGRGTTFKLLLPCADGPAESLFTAPAVPGEWRGSGTVLVVDDEETVRTVSARMIENWGFRAEVAAHGREAVAKFRADPHGFAAVLLDLTMPQMDGTATFTELRRIRPDVRVLLMSGFNEQDAINGFAGKGLAGFVQKPFQPETLQRKLRAVLETPGPNGSAA